MDTNIDPCLALGQGATGEPRTAMMDLGLRYINRNLAEVVRHAALSVARRKRECLCDVVEGEGPIDVGLQLVELKETLEFSETF